MKRLYSILMCLAVCSGAAEAAVVTYDASSGLLPQSFGWVYTDNNNPAASVSVGGGLLSLSSSLANRARWDFDLTTIGATGGEGLFMEVTMRVNSESHTSVGRGIALPQLVDGNGMTASGIDIYAWTDRIFVNDSFDTTVATYLMNTTDRFHTYRAELLGGNFRVFVDGSLVLSGITPVGAEATPIAGGGFGDPSAFSQNNTSWTTATLGNLAEVPEPSSLSLVGLGYLGLVFARRKH